MQNCSNNLCTGYIELEMSIRAYTAQDVV